MSTNNIHQKTFGYETYSFRDSYEKLIEWRDQIWQHLTDDSMLPPEIEIKRIGASIVTKYFHARYGHVVGKIFVNETYLPPEDICDGMLAFYIMRLAHDLCQCVAMRKNNSDKVPPHGKEVKALLKKIGIAYNGTKKPLSFTNDSLIQALIEETLEETEIVYPELQQPPTRKAKAVTPPENTQNTAPIAQEAIPDSWKAAYDNLKQQYEELLKTTQELQHQLQEIKPPLAPMDTYVGEEKEHATT